MQTNTDPSNNLTETPIEQFPAQSQLPVTPLPAKSPLIPLLLVTVAVSLGLAGFFAYQNYQMSNQKSLDTQRPTVADNPTASTLPSTNEENSPLKNEADSVNSFTYNTFTLNYPKSWKLSELSTDKNFPLKERLESLYKNDKVVALSKNDTYLVITIEKSKDSEVGGIFTDEKEYNDYISKNDKVLIGDSTFYLFKDHTMTSELVDYETGPYTWGSLSEYIPSYKTESGAVFKGHNDVIMRNVYSYNFIITGEKTETTNPELEKEIITMLQTIKW